MADDDTEDQDPAATAAESAIDAGAQAPPPRDPTPPTMSELMTGTPHSDDLHSEEEYQAQLENQHKTQVFNDNKHYLEQQQRIQYIQQQMQDLANTPQPQMLQQRPPPSNEEKTSATQNVLQLLAIAGIAFSVFGARRNSYSQGALMGGMGALLQGYAQGRTERQKEALINWHKLNEDIQKQNQDRRKEYERIWSNKKLNLDEQLKLTEYMGKFYNSSRMVTNAQNKQVDKIHKHIQDMKKAELTHSVQTPYGTKEDTARYATLVKEMSGLDLNTPEGANWALHNYPFSQYLNQKETKITTETEDKEGHTVRTTRGGFIGRTPPEKVKTDLDRAMDQKFGGVKPKAKSSTTTDDQNKSVLQPDEEGTGL